MSSSNRHWPSMFRSKPCGYQLQHDSAAISPNCHSKPSSTPYSAGLEERSPEPKPRWNPKPEQIRILEAIFNSGMVNPPREEIRKIRVQLQEFGQVGDANVFYWFQNRKSRSKNKLRSAAASAAARNKPHSQPPPPPPPLFTTTTTTTTSSSSSSSEKSCAGSQTTLQAMHLQPPTATASLMNSQTYLPPDLSGIGDHFPNLQDFVGFPPAAADHGTTLNSTTTLWAELLGQTPSKTVQLHHLYGIGTSAAAPTMANPINEIQGGGGSGRSTVFINEVAFEVAAGMPLNVKEAFGGVALLLDHSGRPVITDEWGITIHPLQHGASYYLV